ncbi:hypothetical protein, partial [Angelakisella massiliensis]|uniref:hypothetical protein n=1 Tax=Angelakisella massiliensis TaxID=1871018 RepID=UPI0024B0C65E
MKISGDINHDKTAFATGIEGGDKKRKWGDRKSGASLGAKRNFLLEYGGKVSGPGTAGEDYFFAEALVCS